VEVDDKIEKSVDLLRRRAIDRFEVYGTLSDVLRAESKEGTMGSLVRSRESGVGIRVIRDDAVGFAYGSEVTDDLIDSALTAARYQFKDPHNAFPGQQRNYIRVSTFDPNVESLEAEECIRRAVSLEQSARDADSRISQVRKASFSRSVSEVRIVNSHGVDASAAFSFVSSSIMVMARQDDDTQAGYEFGFSHALSDVDVVNIGRQAAKRATDLLMAKKIRTMKIPVLFDNTTTAQMLEFISDAFVGENVIKGKSFLKDKIGMRCFSLPVTLSDDALDSRASDACPFDGEGVTTRKTILVDKGTVLSFVYDTYWGNVAGKGSTGNSMRGGYRSTPSLGIRHLCMEPGIKDMAEELKAMKRFLKVTDIMGMHTANPITGEFSVGINGILMEGDEPVYPVREAAISGNMYELFSRVAAIGTDMREFGHVLCPSILVETIDVSAQ